MALCALDLGSIHAAEIWSISSVGKRFNAIGLLSYRRASAEKRWGWYSQEARRGKRFGCGCFKAALLRREVLHRAGSVDAVQIDVKNGHRPGRAPRLRLLF